MNPLHAPKFGKFRLFIKEYFTNWYRLCIVW